eukprot:UN3428
MNEGRPTASLTRSSAKRYAALKPAHGWLSVMVLGAGRRSSLMMLVLRILGMGSASIMRMDSTWMEPRLLKAGLHGRRGFDRQPEKSTE